jgi:hypothetical protein
MMPVPLAARALLNGRWAEVWPLTFGRARLCVGRARDVLSYDDEW